MAYLNTRMWREARAYMKDMGERGLCKEYIKQTDKMLRRFAEFCQSRGIGSASMVTTDTLRQYMETFGAFC